MTDKTCFNCGLPDDCTTRQGSSVVLRLRPSNSFCREARRKVWCCSDECAYQATFLQLETRSTREAITRLLGLRPITFGQFLRLPIELVETRSDRAETISEVVDSVDSKNGKIGFMGLPHMDLVSARENGFKTRKGGRPRKWKSEAERHRAYRERSLPDRTPETRKPTRRGDAIPNVDLVPV